MRGLIKLQEAVIVDGKVCVYFYYPSPGKLALGGSRFVYI